MRIHYHFHEVLSHKKKEMETLRLKLFSYLRMQTVIKKKNKVLTMYGAAILYGLYIYRHFVASLPFLLARLGVGE